jgi:hypothetical protein
MKLRKTTLYITFSVISILIFFLWMNLSDFSERAQYFDIADRKIDQYNIKKKDYVVVIDYRKNIFSKRLYLLDMVNRKVILHCMVTHAYNSGIFYATNFSNQPNSEKSSVGAFISKYSRPGKYGYSMVISGLDKGKNDNAENRAIIFHETPFPWSLGCFATLKSNNKTIIDIMKNGRFIYVID